MSVQSYNAENERPKRRYFAYLKEAKRYGESSIDHVAKALHRFEQSTRFREFRKFHIEQAIAFKRKLAEQRNAVSGEPLSKSTMYSTLAALKSFFTWVAGEPGFRSRLSYSDGDYFSLSEKDTAIDWVLYLTRDKLFGPADPLFPRTQMRHGADLRFEVAGLRRGHWAGASPIRQIFKEAFAAAGLPYFTPHSFRDTLARLAEQRCATPEEFKAWSQNLGLTTFSSYGTVPGAQQADIMRRLALPKAPEASVLDQISLLIQLR